jgi:hypothetical protein
MKYFAAFFPIIFCAQMVFAQNPSIKLEGMIVDEAARTGVPGATVLFINIKDSTRSRFAATSENGQFKVAKLEKAFYRLNITSMGFKPYSRILRVTKNANLGIITLEQDEKILDEVEVIGDVIPMEQKGDTLLYNAGAFKVNPDASATDLVRKMPGILVDNSGVSANGEKIEQVLMDGKRFFGQDPLLSLNTIPAEVVDKVEVFDQMSERAQFTGFDDGNTTKTMNVVTKENKRNGLFGKFSGGYGTNDRYATELSLNSFNQDRRLTVIGMSNNINQLNFANEDIVGVGGSGGRRGGFRSGVRGGGAPGISNFLTSNQSGITTTNSAGVNFSDDIGKKLTLEGSYFFNATSNSNDQNTSRETFREAGSQFYNEIQNSSSDNMNHRLNMRINYDINENNRLLYIPSFSFQNNEGLDYTFGVTSNARDEMINQTDNIYKSTNSGFSINNYLLFQHKFEKIGRSISLSVNSRIRQTDRENYYEEYTQDSLTQYLTDEANNSFKASVTYTEPVGLNGELSASYSINQNSRQSNKETYLLDPETDEKEFSQPLSNEFASGYTTQLPSFRYSNRSFGRFFNVGISYQNAVLDNRQVYPQEGTIQKSFNSILPTAMGRLQLKSGGNVFFRYNTSTNEPSVTQLQNVIDNSNPLFFSLGNPDLDQSYSHSLMVRASGTNPEKNTSIANFTRVQTTSNYITNATEFAERDSVYTGGIKVKEGTQLSVPVNLDGYWNILNNTTYSKMISKIKSNLNTSLGLVYVRRPGLTEGTTNISNTYSINMRLGLSSNISENVDFNTYYNISANTVSNSIESKSNSNSQYVTQTIGGKINLIFWKGIVFRTDVYYEKYNGISDDFNSEYILWNVSLAKKFLKNDLGELELVAFDILNQNRSFSQTVTPNYIEEKRTQVLQQYFMLKFTYQLRKFSSGKKVSGEQ